MFGWKAPAAIWKFPWEKESQCLQLLPQPIPAHKSLVLGRTWEILSLGERNKILVFFPKPRLYLGAAKDTAPAPRAGLKLWWHFGQLKQGSPRAVAWGSAGQFLFVRQEEHDFKLWTFPSSKESVPSRGSTAAPVKQPQITERQFPGHKACSWCPCFQMVPQVQGQGTVLVSHSLPSCVCLEQQIAAATHSSCFLFLQNAPKSKQGAEWRVSGVVWVICTHREGLELLGCTKSSLCAQIRGAVLESFGGHPTVSSWSQSWVQPLPTEQFTGKPWSLGKGQKPHSLAKENQQSKKKGPILTL